MVSHHYHFRKVSPADLRFSPTLVVTIWDVTDKSIDKFSQSVIEKIHLNKATLQNWSYDDLQTKKGQCSVVAAVASSRDVVYDGMVCNATNGNLAFFGQK